MDILYDKSWFWFIAVILAVLMLKHTFLYRKIVIPFVINADFTTKLVSVFKWLLEFVLILSLILVSFDISIPADKEIRNEKVLNIEILYDVSLSMTAKDILPSRFDASKDALKDFVSGLEGYNIWMIAFSGIPIVYSPMTNDNLALLDKIDSMRMSDFPPTLDFVGTAIGDSILLGIKELEKINKNSKTPWVIVLVTDGDSNKWLNPEMAAGFSKKENIPIYILAIGKEDFVIGYDHYGSGPIETYINIENLEKISDISNGKLKEIKEKRDFKDMFDAISGYVKSFEKTEEITKYNKINKYIIPGVLVILLFYILFFVTMRFSFRWYKKE